MKRALRGLLVVQGLGALVAAGLWALAPSMLGVATTTRVFAIIPALLGFWALDVAHKMSANRWWWIFALVVQESVLVVAIIGLVFTNHELLWLALLGSIVGSILVFVALAEERRLGSYDS